MGKFGFHPLCMAKCDVGDGGEGREGGGNMVAVEVPVKGKSLSLVETMMGEKVANELIFSSWLQVLRRNTS
jgi:hypothetical protein